MKTRLERFMDKVDKNGPTPEEFPELGPCWIWLGASDKLGYGSFGTGLKKPNGKTKITKAHRWSYGHFVEPIPEGKGVLHKCDVPSCVNPTHLKTGTHDENIKEAAERNRIPKGDESSRRRNAPKLSREAATAIREQATGRWGEQTEMAREYGVSQAMIRQVLKGECWAED